MEEFRLLAALGNGAVTCVFSCIVRVRRGFFSELALGSPAQIGKRRSTTSHLTKSGQGLRVTCARITAGRLVVPVEENSSLGSVPHAQ